MNRYPVPPGRTSPTRPTPPMTPPTTPPTQSSLPLAMAYVPWQSWSQPYPPHEALCRGTLFPALYLPFGKGGRR